MFIDYFVLNRFGLVCFYGSSTVIGYSCQIYFYTPGKGVAPSPTPRCSSYQKRSLRVVLDYGHQQQFLYILTVLFQAIQFSISTVFCKPGHWHIVRVFANGPGDRGSIPSQVIPKKYLKKMVLDAALLSTQHYKVRVKWSNPGNGVAPYPTPWYSSY